MRVFIAIKPPDLLKEKISVLQTKLGLDWSGIKWIAAQNVHLTCKFLGEQDEEMVEQVKRELVRIAERLSPFSLFLRGVLLFPDARYPRVLVGEITEGKEALLSLVEEIENAMVAIGIPPETRSFQPHTTFARFKAVDKLPQFKLALKNFENMEFGSWKVAKVFLIKSVLKPDGPYYSDLLESELGKKK